MRNILFRGKDEYHPDNWVYGSLKMFKVCSIFCNTLKTFLFVDADTVGQFTEKVDKYGKKIFEGDIVKTKYGRLCIVTWFDSRMHVGWDLDVVNTRENVRNTSAPDAYDMWASENLEVVGNIHDNPEMLRD